MLGMITSAGADYKYAIADNQTPATNGTQAAAAVLLRDADATDADAKGVIIARDAEVKGDSLNYFTGTSNNNKPACMMISPISASSCVRVLPVAPAAAAARPVMNPARPG